MITTKITAASLKITQNTNIIKIEVNLKSIIKTSLSFHQLTTENPFIFVNVNFK